MITGDQCHLTLETGIAGLRAQGQVLNADEGIGGCEADEKTDQFFVTGADIQVHGLFFKEHVGFGEGRFLRVVFANDGEAWTGRAGLVFDGEGEVEVLFSWDDIVTRVLQFFHFGFIDGDPVDLFSVGIQGALGFFAVPLNLAPVIKMRPDQPDIEHYENDSGSQNDKAAFLRPQIELFKESCHSV